MWHKEKQPVHVLNVFCTFLLFFQDIIILALSSVHIQILHLVNK
jgi:hypothetical protein